MGIQLFLRTCIRDNYTEEKKEVKKFVLYANDRFQTVVNEIVADEDKEWICNKIGPSVYSDQNFNVSFNRSVYKSDGKHESLLSFYCTDGYVVLALSGSDADKMFMVLIGSASINESFNKINEKDFEEIKSDVFVETIVTPHGFYHRSDGINTDSYNINKAMDFLNEYMKTGDKFLLSCANHYIAEEIVEEEPADKAMYYTKYNDLICMSRSFKDAKEILHRIKESCDKIGFLTLGSLYDIVNVADSFKVKNHTVGWEAEDLKDLEIVRKKDGYYLYFPNPRDINDVGM